MQTGWGLCSRRKFWWANVDDIVGSLRAGELSSHVGGVNEQEEGWKKEFFLSKEEDWRQQNGKRIGDTKTGKWLATPKKEENWQHQKQDEESIEKKKKKKDRRARWWRQREN